jgi:hypothetical protein
MMHSSQCLHVQDHARIKGHTLPYKAHIRFAGSRTAIEETIDGVYIEFDHESCTPFANEWMSGLTPPEEQALYDAVSHDALRIYNMKRLRGERIDGEDRTS